MKKKILVLCTGNSCRSQMAETILRRCAGEFFDVHSAGSHPTGYVHPLALEVTSEEGFELEDPRSKNLSEFLDRNIDIVVTVCGKVDQACPEFPGQRERYHWPFDDPAGFQGSDENLKAGFRHVFGQIRQVCEAYAAGLREGRNHSIGSSLE